MKLKIFLGTGATISVAAHIALEEAGADYETVRLDFARSEQRSEPYLSINSKGRVPTLETPQGRITETPAILIYIAQVFPAAKLAPLDNPYELAKLQEFNAYLCSTVHVAHAHKLRGSRWSDEAATVEALKVKVPQNMTECFDLIERNYFKGPWVMGEQYTVADPYLFVIARWLEADGVDPSAFPKTLDHRNRMSERPKVKKVLAQYS